jgi:hypothetical protein
MFPALIANIGLQILIRHIRTSQDVRKTDHLTRFSVLLLVLLSPRILIRVDQFSLGRARLNPAASTFLFRRVDVFRCQGVDDPIALFAESLTLLVAPFLHH